MDHTRSQGQLKNEIRHQPKTRVALFSLFSLLVVSGLLTAQDVVKTKAPVEVSFKKDVAPILDKFCTTCHSSEEDHPSQLFMDSYETLMMGGKHGKAIVPGNSSESLLSRKLSEDPPFGKAMPPPRKPRPTAEQVELIRTWIDQGAKKN
jgi:uncharacterized membrane protein